MDEEKINEFCSVAMGVVGGLFGVWPQFLADMAEYGYDEDDVENIIEQIDKRAGRC